MLCKLKVRVLAEDLRNILPSVSPKLRIKQDKPLASSLRD